MAEKTTESRFSPKALAERLDHSGNLDLDSIRDQVASALPRRWSEFILRLEQKRFENAAQKGPTGVGEWVIQHNNGSAFYHYIMVCHYKPGVKPTPKGFAKSFNHDNLINSYYRMMNEWIEKKWCDEKGRPSENLLKSHAQITYEIMELEEVQILMPHSVTFIQSMRNRKLDEQRQLEKKL